MSVTEAPQSEGGTGRLARIASPFAVGVGSRIIGQAIAFSLVVVASRHLSLAEFGVYALTWAAAVIATTFVFTGFYHAILRADDLEARINPLFWLIALVGASGGAAILAIGALVGVDTELGGALLLVAPLPLLAVPTAWNEAQLLRARRARAASLYTVAAESLALLTAVAMLAQGYGILALIGARWVAALTGLAITIALVRRLPRLSLRRDDARQGGRTALPLWGTTAIGMFTNYGADIILAAYLTPAAVGAYRSGARIAMTAADVVFQPLRMLSWSRFSRMELQGQRGEIRAAWVENTAFAGAMLFPVMAGVGLLAEDLVVTVFDESWAAAAPIVAILCLARAVATPQTLAEPTLMCMDKARLQVLLRIFSGVLLLIALLSLGRLGPAAAAWGVTLTMLVTTLVTLVVLVRVLGLSVRDMAGAFGPGLAIAALCAVSVIALAPRLEGMGTGAALLVHIAAGAAIWAVCVGGLMRARILVLPTP
jgi:O-antigen/teichoic acid export membrane protein